MLLFPCHHHRHQHHHHHHRHHRHHHHHDHQIIIIIIIIIISLIVVVAPPNRLQRTRDNIVTTSYIYNNNILVAGSVVASGSCLWLLDPMLQPQLHYQKLDWFSVQTSCFQFSDTKKISFQSNYRLELIQASDLHGSMGGSD